MASGGGALPLLSRDTGEGGGPITGPRGACEGVREATPPGSSREGRVGAVWAPSTSIPASEGGEGGPHRRRGPAAAPQNPGSMRRITGRSTDVGQQEGVIFRVLFLGVCRKQEPPSAVMSGNLGPDSRNRHLLSQSVLYKPHTHTSNRTPLHSHFKLKPDTPHHELHSLLNTQTQAPLNLPLHPGPHI